MPTAVAVDAAFLLSRFTAAVALPRALPIAEFAPLSHMLMNGFFLVQGFFILIAFRTGQSISCEAFSMHAARTYPLEQAPLRVLSKLYRVGISDYALIRKGVGTALAPWRSLHITSRSFESVVR